MMARPRSFLQQSIAAATLLASFGASLFGGEKPKNEREDIFRDTAATAAREDAKRNISAQIDAELASRHVPVPAGMQLQVEWYSPHINAGDGGHIVKGWVKGDLVLLETDKRYLYAIRRHDGVTRWRCQLDDAIRYEPAVSRNNVVVNVNNYLVGIERNGGEIRWRLAPDFVMSCAPLIFDPPSYPLEYTKNWKALETIYVGSWEGRFHALEVRARMSYFIKKVIESESFAAPEFGIFRLWHKTHKNRGSITTPIHADGDWMFYTADDNNAYAINREGDKHILYEMLGPPSTRVTVAPNTSNIVGNVYVGARDSYIYALDRLTLRKKWTYAPGVMATGAIMQDDYASPYLYIPTSDGRLHALKITLPRPPSKDKPEVLESFAHAWDIPGVSGVITSSPDIVYVGLANDKGYNGFKGISAVKKETGKVLWTVDGGFFTAYLENHNRWTEEGGEARVYAIASDNRLVSLKEFKRDTGLPKPKEEKKEEPKPKKKEEAPADSEKKEAEQK